MGEAAGIAARFAVEGALPLRSIDGAAVREVMAKRGDPLLCKKYEEE